jgi:hypothetical protein
MNRTRNFLFCLLIILVGACAHRPPSTADKTSPPKIVPPVQEGTALSDSVLFNEGMLSLGGSGRAADYTKARTAFDILLKTYPASKKRDLSEALLHLIDEVLLCQEKNIAARLMIDKADAEKRSLREGNEQLKSDLKLLGDKFQAEITKLREENEQLKKDIQLLKKLEIQLDKREKMLR